MAMGLQSAGRGRKRRAPMSEINVTPFVDVMLVLLIIFMVAAPLLVTGAAVDLPETSAPPLPADVEPVSVTLTREGQRMIGDEVLAPEPFMARLAGIREGRGSDVRVVIRADAAIPYGEVARLLADVTGAGFTRVALVNRPMTEPAR
ncbi:MAG: ExbD/TolR family protein [Sphingomonadaceae bacterium]